MIGLAIKARKCVTGADLCLEYIKKDKVRLLFIASDCTENTKKKEVSAAEKKSLEPFYTFSMNQLGDITGKEEISVIAITDYNFARGIREKITKEN